MEACAGKWHQGYPTLDYVPESRGFDEYLGYLTGACGRPVVWPEGQHRRVRPYTHPTGAEDYYTHVKAPVTTCPTTRDLWRGSHARNYHQPANESKYFPMCATAALLLDRR